MSQPIASVGGLFIHIFRVAFFIEKEDRISRGEYWVGALLLWLLFLLLIIVGMLAFMAFAHVWLLPIDHILFPYIHFITDKVFISIVTLSGVVMIVPLINLMVKRLHDVGLPGWRLLLPLPITMIRLWIYRFFVSGDPMSNHYGDNPSLSSIYFSSYTKTCILIVVGVLCALIGIVYVGEMVSYDIRQIEEEYHSLNTRENIFCQKKYHIPAEYFLSGETVLSDDIDVLGYYNCTDDDILESDFSMGGL